MKKIIILLILLLILFTACQNSLKPEETKYQEYGNQAASLIGKDLIDTAVIYEANIRQYSHEGTLKAFERDIPKLKKLGVKIIWLMPVFPISEVKRKATGDKFVSDIADENEQEKYLGSPYAVANYKKINPDFGTLSDLKNLVDTAHKNGMIVILDWVANHTGWDHPWIKEHPEYYTHNKKGEITDPLNVDGSSKGWQDVADLNYENPGLRRAMINNMKYWLSAADIDGFRCDVAGEVPVDFWKEAISQLRAQKKLFMLAEAWEPELLKKGLFDACYGWESHFLLADIAKAKKTVVDWDNYMQKIDTIYEPDDIIMNFTSNHDENSWKGTVYETFGNLWEEMAVITYLTKGMPLLYSGQEYGLKHRLKFFEKDTIPKNQGKEFELYKKLGKLKNTCKALKGSDLSVNYTRIKTNNDANVLAFIRSFDGKILLFVGNISSDNPQIRIDYQGNFTDYMTGEDFMLRKDKSVYVEKGKYLILISNK
jgi:glycosidase